MDPTVRSRFTLPSGKVGLMVDYDEPTAISAVYAGVDDAVEEEDVDMCILIYEGENSSVPESRVILRAGSSSILARGTAYKALGHTHEANETWEEALSRITIILGLIQTEEEQGSGVCLADPDVFELPDDSADPLTMTDAAFAVAADRSGLKLRGEEEDEAESEGEEPMDEEEKRLAKRCAIICVGTFFLFVLIVVLIIALAVSLLTRK